VKKQQVKGKKRKTPLHPLHHICIETLLVQAHGNRPSATTLVQRDHVHDPRRQLCLLMSIYTHLLPP
ncbi:hypothetical protein NEUTE2DRAFT_73806, partial [Neurospora tetrasperma FGSC 2509]